ncbi:linear amide C-N hydrolase [Rickettsiales bacterium LUAb2]
MRYGSFLCSVSLLVTMLFSLISSPINACTRILWNNKLGTVVSRSMDWPTVTDPVITVFPKGINRNGGMLAGKQIIQKNPAMWTSKYGSMVTTIFGIGTVDGFNEKGLGAHLLYLNNSEYEPRNPNKPGVQVALWAQYVLDNAATVNEALALLDKVQIVEADVKGPNGDIVRGTVHLIIEDKSGDSAIIEYLNGKVQVHHSKKFRVATNDPAYTEQLALLSQVNFKNPSSNTILPGNVSSSDRFIRANYYLNLLPEPKTTQESVASILSVARNASVPFGAPYKQFGIYNTEYRTVMDLTDSYYFFELTNSPSTIWADLSKFNLNKGAKVMELDPHDYKLSGDITKQFKAINTIPF